MKRSITRGISRQHWLTASALLLVAALTAMISWQAWSATVLANSVGSSALVSRQVTAKNEPASISANQSGAAVATSSATTVSPTVSCSAINVADPNRLDLSQAAAGVTIEDDPILFYTLHGSSIAQVSDELAQCAPHIGGGDNFSGYTAYTLSWQYAFMANSAGQCVVADAKVGLHLNEVLPFWKPKANNTPAADITRWQHFETSLQTHEQGHAELDKQYANALVSDLQQLTSARCETLTNIVQQTINKDLSALAQANNNYDVQTQHGATQGAIL